MNIKKFLCLFLATVCMFNVTALTACNKDANNGDSTSADSNDPTDSTVTDKTADSGAATSAPSATDATTAATSAATDANPYGLHTYELKDIKDKLNILGRSDMTEDGLNADWSAAGFEFVADCEREVRITMTSSHNCRFNVYVDGGEKKAVMVSSGERTYSIAKNLEKGTHTFRIVKSSMVEYSTEALAVTIGSVQVYGQINSPAPQREFFVEFVGDSITCGVGASSSTSSEAFSELSYAYLLANKLDFDYSLVSISGIGAAKSTDRHNGLLMGTVYPLTNYYRSQTEKYDPERKADLVVINLNTNDKGSYTSLSQKDEFVSKVKGLIDSVKAIHGEDVKILWVFGTMIDVTRGYCDIWTIEYLNSLGGEKAGYYYHVASPNQQGGASHPIASAHETVADDLAKLIEDKKILK